jgi:hypothetical protein
MVRSVSRWLLVGMLVVSALVGSVGHLGSRAGAQEPQFSAAATTPINQIGEIGKIYLSTLPLNCSQYSTPYEYVSVPQYVHPPIYVTASPGVVSQKVGVTASLLQALPSGGHQELLRGPEAIVEDVGTSPVAVQPYGNYTARIPGPDYVIGYQIRWYAPTGSGALGVAGVIQSNYFVTINGVFVRDDAPVCSSYWKPSASLTATTGTVNATVGYQLARYPFEVPVSIKWDGASIGSVTTSKEGTATGSLFVPASPMGTHKLTFSTGHWTASATYTVKPRIKLIPSTVSRGQTVNVSLRGYAKYELVRIRWKKGTSWVEVGRVTTSSTGSANMYIKVPTWAPAGTNSVRGDGSYGHAQTNAVYVDVALMGTSATPPTATPTKTPTPAPSAIPATATPTLSPTASPTVVVTTPEPTATPTGTETATPAPDETATPMPVTETPTPQPTAAATAESSPGAPAPGEEAS